jgi:uncharacterized cupredoxin-like copper-binding protein
MPQTPIRLLGSLMIAALPCRVALAESTIVKVELQDTTTSDALQGMHMKLDHDSVKAGSVTFRVTNESKALVHEMLVIRTNLPVTALPYDPKKDRFIESKMKSLGEVEELQSSVSGQLTLNLKPGNYLLTCNQPGHLHAGMWSKFTVTP